MKWSFLLFSSFLCLQAIAQYPATGNKMRLGWQTTGDGLVYRGAIGDTTTLDPSGLNNAWMLLDTASGNLYAYRAKAWRLVSGGGGGGGLTMPFDSVTFNVNETDASLRELKYSEEKGYLQYGGQDSVQIPLLPGIWYVRNDTSVTIPKGTVVRATGTLGASGRIKVKHMIANGSIDAMYVLGIAMQDIAVGADGYAMSQGKIRKINTQAYSEGAVLYADVDTLGGLTQTEPTGSNLKLPIAFVVHSASNGTLAVRVSPGTYLRDLHDVYITSPASNASLYYNTSESVWRDTTGAVLTSDTSVFARDFQISGTTNYLAKFTGSNAVGNSGVFESGGNIGIGTTTPRTPLDIRFSGSYPNYYTDTIARIEFNETGAGCCMDITGMYVKANGGGGQSNVGIIGEGGGVNYDKSIGIKGIGKHNDTQGPGIAYGVVGEVSASKLGSSGAIGTTIAGYFKNTAKVDGTHYGVLVETDSSGDYGIYQTGFGANYFKGNVGINTTTPSYRLDVNGDVNTTGMYKKSGTDIISGTTDYIAKFKGTNQVGDANIKEVVGNSSNEYVLRLGSNSDGERLAYLGNRLILGANNSDTYNYYADNPANDQSNLAIVSASDGDTLISVGRRAGASVNKARFFLRNTISEAIALGVASDNATTFYVSQPNSGSGNVGIATSSPSRPLHVNANSSMIIPSGATGTRPASGANGDIRYNTDNANFEWYSGSAWREPVNAARSPAAGLANRFSKFDANGLLDTSAVLIQNGSNIGIGTASATNLLTIKSQSTSDIPVSVRSSAASNINIVALSESNGAGAVSLKDKNGNTDIVLNTDITAFNISNDTTPPYIIAASYSPTSSNGPEINLSRARGTEASPSAVSNDDELGEINFSGRSTSSGQITAAIRALADSVVTSRLNTGLAFYTGATTATLTERMRINSKGKVGIGNSPAITDSALTITGGIRTTTSIRTGSDAIINGMTVGLGASNVASNLAFGNGALASWDGTGSGTNVAIGALALNLARQTLGASSNLAIGGNALSANTNTANNVAIGADAMKLYNKTGAGAGGGNVAIGGSALYFLQASASTPVADNVAIGLLSMAYGVNSDANVAIGSSAMTRAQGNQNIAIGNAALASSADGGINYRAGITRNTSIGSGAMQFVSSNSIANTAIGFGALQRNLFEGDSSVYIGAYSNASSTTATNEIVIGATAVGNGSNTTTIGNSSTTHTVLQYGETLLGYAASGDVGDYRVQVNGNGYVSNEFRIGYTADQGNYPLQVNGQIFATNATIATSDARLKQDIEPLKSGLKEVLSLNPVTYTFKPDTVNNYPKGKQVGFLAQEIKATVQGDYAGSIVQEAGGYLGVADTKLIPLLVKAIQEQQAQIEALKKEIEALKNK